MTTCSTDVAPSFKPKKKRKGWSLPRMFKGNLTAAAEEIAAEVFEGVGGKDYLAALFANGVLGDRSSKKGGPEVSSTVHRGKGKYARRRYRIDKLGGGQYDVEREKL